MGAPVVTTLNGKGLLDERKPCSLGHARSVGARRVLPHADAMLAAGCRFTEVMTDWRRMPVPKNLIQIDLDPDQIGVNYPVVVGIVADARAALEAIISALPAEGGRSAWGKLFEEARSAVPANPEWLIDTLRDALPGEVPVFTDACEMGYRMQAEWLGVWPAPVLLSVQLHRAGVGVPGCSRSGGGARRTGRWFPSAATAVFS